jgi:hypothetical protein
MCRRGRSEAAGTLGFTMSEYTDRLKAIGERVSAARGFL